MHLNDIPELERLSTAEKILLVEDLWESVASDESKVPVPQSHTDELEKRFIRYASHPGDLLSVEELQRRLENRK